MNFYIANAFMKSLLVALIALVFTVMSLSAADSSSGEPAVKKNKLLYHMVSFKFKDTASKEDIRKVEKAFAALPKTIPQIVSFKWGTNNSPEGLNKGFTHGFILSFKSEEDRDAYLVHPDHKEFGKIVGPVLDDVFVVDFWNQY